jgi:hypothetical protein
MINSMDLVDVWRDKNPGITNFLKKYGLSSLGPYIATNIIL